VKVGVLGVGLIGGSIGLAARRRGDAEVHGYDADPRVLDRALELGAIDVQAADAPGAVEGADVVFAAGPVGALKQLVGAALDVAPANCVVSDVGSTKRFLADAGSDERFIGGHPLAGAETAGVEHARDDLFEGATWYLTPARESTAGVLYERLHRLLTRFGARPTAIDAETHDRLMACVSHLPHVLANLLVAQAHELVEGEGSPRLPAVGPSFRDATRVAGANSAIWTDIYLSNRDALIDGIDEVAGRLVEVRAALEARDAAAITAWNERARADRDAVLGAGREAAFDLAEEPAILRVDAHDGPRRAGLVVDGLPQADRRVGSGRRRISCHGGRRGERGQSEGEAEGSGERSEANHQSHG